MRPVEGLPLLHIDRPQFTGVRRFAKEGIDRTFGAIALLVASPVMLVVAVAVRLSSRGPVIYRQARVGLRGRQFNLYKFRSMRNLAEQRRYELDQLNDHDGVLFKIRRDPRVTTVGRFLRRFSLDELPQLWNVVRGDMSLVGPRPPLPEEVERYGGDVHRRLLVKPGLTGLWQVSGRSDLSWDETVRLDLHYVDNWSVGLDLVLLLKTLTSVLRGRGAY
jgi:exopolysaccharide biosynthesis polyprenyl glycosylphosphotransferase